MYLPGFVNLVVEYWRKLHTLQIFSHKFTFLSEKNIKASLGSKHILFSYFIITEPTELKLSQIASPGNSNAVNFFQKVSYIFSHGMQPSWIECCV